MSLEQPATLSGWLAQLSFKSLERIGGSLLEIPEDWHPYEGEYGWSEEVEIKPESFEVLQVKPSRKARVVAVDVACKRLGFTREGVLCAVRGVLAWRDEYAYHYQRYGPYTFHLTDGWIFQALEESLPPSLESPLNPLGLTAKIQMLIERELQLQACKTFKDSLILFDGILSVVTGAGGKYSEKLREALAAARRNGSRVLALAKSTKLLVEGGAFQNLILRLKPPSLIHLSQAGTPKRNFRSFGRIFLARLTQDYPGFRLDVDAGLTLEESLEAVGSLLASDLFVQGYPETLRMAHMLSVFTPLDVLAIQRFLTQNFGVKVRRERGLRRMLFGPFAGWEEAGA